MSLPPSSLRRLTQVCPPWRQPALLRRTGTRALAQSKQAHASQRRWQGRLMLGLMLGLMAFLMVAVPARADEYTEVNRLSRNGQLQQALARAEAHLARQPRDPQMRFMRAGILSELDRKDEAEKMLLALTQDYPELPEPYNNLAVLLAARNELEQARAALEMALRNDSAYATAHENLGDVLAQLAARSYAKALELDPSRQRIAPKLQMLQQLGQKPPQP